MAVRSFVGAVVEQQLGDAFVAAVGNSAARCDPREQALLDFDALRLVLVFSEADPGDFGVGVGHARNHSCIESCDGQFLVALQFTGDDFRCHVGFVHRLIRQHGLADDVADGEDVGHVGAHLDVGVDEASVGDGDECFIGKQQFRNISI